MWFVATVLAATPVAAVSVFRAVQVAWPRPVVQLLSFTPWLVLPAAVGLACAALSRRAWLLATTASLLALQLFWLFPLGHARPTQAADTRRVELKVMNINAQLGRADAAEIVRLVRDNGIGLLAVEEYTPALEDRLAAEGLASLLPNRISRPDGRASGAAVYSLHPLRLTGAVPDSQFLMPMVRLDLHSAGDSAGDSAGQTSLEVTIVHAKPPVDAGVVQWRQDLAALGKVAARPGNVVLIGDFNATYDHAEFRQLLAGAGGRPTVDVGVAAGSRLIPTWPMDGLPLPGIVIDHILTNPEISGGAYSVHPVPGTDHAAILATLSIPVEG
ncbi:Metal-dependent hydrolase, endonuclease/exonuclease/phosphatase family [Arthrobacter sp. ov118]|nr:Metal-dependent hydrolase, endonuclease/exonuclease/phosphatase family [Arthrobacter sp. ov118]